MTTYEYEEVEQGAITKAKLGPQHRIVRAVTVHEPEFTDRDRDLALDRMRVKAEACPGCGEPRSEVWPATPEEWAEMQHDFESEPIVCVKCATRDRTARNYQKGPHDPDGIHFPTWRRDGA